MFSSGHLFRSIFVAAALLCAQSLCSTVVSAQGVSAAEPPASEEAPAIDPAVARGRYLAIAGNCATCHTAPGGERFAGGLPFKTNFGTIYSTNITSDPDTGIGDWTLKQFQRALRKGIRADGSHLYPAFPYTSFTRITDEDAAALYAYLKTIPAVTQPNRENGMPFPFNQSWGMAVWNLLFFKEGPFQPDPGQTAEWNRGAYLVESLEHCTACHTPRNFMGGPKSDMHMTGGLYTDAVATGDYRDWSPPNLTASSTGLKPWSVDEIVAYLKTGKNTFTASFGPMNDVIMNSTSHLDEKDVRAMAVYLKSLPANEGRFAEDASDQELGRGQTLYDLHCGTCHEPTGLGSASTGARLAGSLIVQAADPASLLNVIIYGPQLSDPPPPVGLWRQMPAFNDKLEDDEIATLASFLRHKWGNKGGKVSVKQVAKQRPPYDSEE